MELATLVTITRLIPECDESLMISHRKRVILNICLGAVKGEEKGASRIKEQAGHIEEKYSGDKMGKPRHVPHLRGHAVNRLWAEVGAGVEVKAEVITSIRRNKNTIVDIETGARADLDRDVEAYNWGYS